jgi:cardiolipin synthase
MSLRHLPNVLCILRILLVYPVGHWILQGRYEEVLALFALAAFTDALDGFLAKTFDWTSDLGRLSTRLRTSCCW